MLLLYAKVKQSDELSSSIIIFQKPMRNFEFFLEVIPWGEKKTGRGVAVVMINTDWLL